MIDEDPIGEIFARLTARYEDAATLAADGQSPKLSNTERRIFLGRIRAITADADNVLAELEQALR